MRAGLSQATMLWPQRSKASDGICASQQHHSQNPSSDHEADSRGLAHAFDLTHDPAHGCDAHKEGERIRDRRDRRMKYKISRRRICSYYPVGNYPAYAERPYHGSNPHDKHMHMSVRREYENDTSPWYEEGDELAGLGEQILAEVQTCRKEVAILSTRVDDLEPAVGKLYPGGPSILKALVKYAPVEEGGPDVPQEHLNIIADMISELLNRQAEMEQRLTNIENKLNEPPSDGG